VLPPAYFDYIHTRVLLGCFTDFKEILSKSFHYLKPGGWMESQEPSPTPYCDDGTMPADWLFLEWAKFLDNAAIEAGKPVRIGHKLRGWYEAAGFVDIQEKVFKLPTNDWPTEKHLKNLGKMSEENWLAGLSGFSMAYFSRVLNWNKDQIEVFMSYERTHYRVLTLLIGLSCQYTEGDHG